jgi:hypothetical protein
MTNPAVDADLEKDIHNYLIPTLESSAEKLGLFDLLKDCVKAGYLIDVTKKKS